MFGRQSGNPIGNLSFLLAALSFSSQPVGAAEHITTRVSEAKTITEIDPSWDASVFEIFLQGEIKAGDREKIATAIGDNAKSVKKAEKIRIHLNSPGGDYGEAVRISDEIWKHGVTTSIASGAKCYSACAVVFMAGRELGYEGPSSLSRFLHVRGDLGFHAPYLPKNSCDAGAAGTTPCTFPLELVSEIYRAAMSHISGLLLGSTNAKWPPNLIGRMLSKGPNELLHIETVEDAGRWHIRLYGGKAPQPLIDQKRATLSCFNAYRWADDNKAGEYPIELLSDSFINEWSKQTKKKKRLRKVLDTEPQEKIDVYTVTIDNMNNLGCTIVHSVKHNAITISTEFGDTLGEPWDDWKLYHPKTLLSDLPVSP